MKKTGRFIAITAIFAIATMAFKPTVNPELEGNGENEGCLRQRSEPGRC